MTAYRSFGKYFKFVLDLPVIIDERPVVQNAFQVMMMYANEKCLPCARETTRKNAKFELYNAVLKFLCASDLGWKRESLHLGKHFVVVLCDALWMLDSHRPTLQQQLCGMPAIFDSFTGFNDPRKNKHVPRLSHDELVTRSQQLFNILEQVNIFGFLSFWQPIYTTTKFIII